MGLKALLPMQQDYDETLAGDSGGKIPEQPWSFYIWGTNK